MPIVSKRPDDVLDELHELNVTPFIDVMLVLLIIFMVTAPLTTVSIPVDLPVAAPNPPLPQVEPVFVTLQSDLSLSIGDRRIVRSHLAGALERASKGNKATRILLRADRKVDYGEIMTVMSLLSNAGYSKVALIGIEG